MTHPRFLSIIKAIKEKGFIVFLKTNGTLINSDNIQYIQKYVDNVTLSRYGCCSDTYDSVTGVSKSYEKYCSAIDLLKKYKIPFKENAILLKENERELESFMQSGCKVEKYISSNVDYPYAEKHRPSDAALFKYYTNYIKNEHFKPSYFLTNLLLIDLFAVVALDHLLSRLLGILFRALISTIY